MISEVILFKVLEYKFCFTFFVTERTSLENGEITKRGFIELNEMEAEDSQGDVEDLWITLTSMGLNKALIMDEVSI